MHGDARRNKKAPPRSRRDRRRQVHTEHFGKLLAAERRDFKRAALARSPHPIRADKMRAQRGADMTCEMRTPLAPIKARPAENAPRFRPRRQVDTEAFEKRNTRGRHLAGIVLDRDISA